MDATQPAFPQAITYGPNGDVAVVGQYFDKEGLSIRAYIATKAMAAFIASGALEKAHAQGVDMDLNQKALVFGAVKIADALIAELSKS